MNPAPGATKRDLKFPDDVGGRRRRGDTRRRERLPHSVEAATLFRPPRRGVPFAVTAADGAGGGYPRSVAMAIVPRWRPRPVKTWPGIYKRKGASVKIEKGATMPGCLVSYYRRLS